MAWTTGKSLALMEARSRRPMPGTAKTCSAMMVPATSSAAVTARKAMTGMMALRRACFFRASARVRPRLKAVRM